MKRALITGIPRATSGPPSTTRIWLWLSGSSVRMASQARWDLSRLFRVGRLPT